MDCLLQKQAKKRLRSENFWTTHVSLPSSFARFQPPTDINREIIINCVYPINARKKSFHNGFSMELEWYGRRVQVAVASVGAAARCSLCKIHI